MKKFDLKSVIDQFTDNDEREIIHHAEKSYVRDGSTEIGLALNNKDENIDFLRIRIANDIELERVGIKAHVLELVADNFRDLRTYFGENRSDARRKLILGGDRGRIVLEIGRCEQSANGVRIPYLFKYEDGEKKVVPFDENCNRDLRYRVGVPMPEQGAKFKKEDYCEISRNHCQIMVMWTPAGGYIVKIADHSSNGTAIVLK
ncbi:hypothetical protein KJ632_03350 [Patescibacteria group bacterium]|nr:hypothetical protein [Patescibacteria group bacterium]